jgi:hypothetical protein
MPAEQEPRLDALRRYVETLGTSDHAPPPRPRWTRRGLVLGAVAAVLILFAGIGIGRAMQPARAEPAATRVAGASTGGQQQASPQCKTAVDRANKSLAIAARVEAALAEHTEYMYDLLHGKISGQVALNKGMPSLIEGASESGKFDAALADYKAVVTRCHLVGQGRP